MNLALVLSRQNIERAIEKQVAFSLYQFANECLQELVDRADKGIRYDGQKQRPNTPSTLKQKNAKGQGSTPLVATQELINPINYLIKIDRENKMRVVIEPSARNKVVLKYLAEMPDPYLFLDLPDKIRGVPSEIRFQEILDRNLSEDIHI